ncbi:hypothetical protein OSSY52_06710 [Tepiditoga spiralis]|uniref:Uncharacterized protein n=1 Tax=Tepiditoga spiralis TaxID=2108365 RepID=A0A7G1G2F6_9BACT|nr:hypothetical protein [Tepiditoga spiralis]BBE30530.1 hypothetical protein OSSY52_06710 [Tepiditoga spiralis]
MNKFLFLMILILILFVGCTEIKTPPPAIEKIGDKIIKENEELNFIVKVKSIEKDNLIYNVENTPKGAIFNGNQIILKVESMM